jgi:hypothetical protein
MKVEEKCLVAVNLSGACERQGQLIFLFLIRCDIPSVFGTKERVYADHQILSSCFFSTRNVEYSGSAGVLHVCPIFPCTGSLTLQEPSEVLCFACTCHKQYSELEFSTSVLLSLDMGPRHSSSCFQSLLQQLGCNAQVCICLPQVCSQNQVCIGHCFILVTGLL